MKSLSMKDWEDGVLVSDYNGTGAEIGASEMSYSDGYLSKITDPDAGGGSGEGYTYIRSYVDDYIWTDGLLTKMIETETETYSDNRPDVVTTSEDRYTYSDKANPENVSFDLNMYLIFAETIGDEMPFAEAIGFLGKSPSKLVSSYTHTYSSGDRSSTTNYTWELDSKGYITKLTEVDDYNTTVMTVTYKN
jgi:hypothetical protein